MVDGKAEIMAAIDSAAAEVAAAQQTAARDSARLVALGEQIPHLDPELCVMQVCVDAHGRLDDSARERVMAYLGTRFGPVAD